jgi:hypothetical protein
VQLAAPAGLCMDKGGYYCISIRNIGANIGKHKAAKLRQRLHLISWMSPGMEKVALAQLTHRAC